MSYYTTEYEPSTSKRLFKILLAILVVVSIVLTVILSLAWLKSKQEVKPHFNAVKDVSSTFYMDDYFTKTYKASGTNVKYSISQGTPLPPGLILNAKTGELYGVATGWADTKIDIIASNSLGIDTLEISLHIMNDRDTSTSQNTLANPSPTASLPINPTICSSYCQELEYQKETAKYVEEPDYSNTKLPSLDTTVGSYYSYDYKIKNSNKAKYVIYSLSSSDAKKISGLTLNPKTGEISGTATGSFNGAVKLKAKNGLGSATLTLYVDIENAQANNTSKPSNSRSRTTYIFYTPSKEGPLTPVYKNASCTLQVGEYLMCYFDNELEAGYGTHNVTYSGCAGYGLTFANGIISEPPLSSGSCTVNFVSVPIYYGSDLKEIHLTVDLTILPKKE